MLSLALLLLPQAWADCEVRVDLAELDDALAAAESAFSDLTGALDFYEAVAEAQAALTCLREPIDASNAARYHRLQGLVVYPDDPDAAAGSFAASRLLEPSFSFSEALVPKGAPQRDAYGAVDLSAGRYHALTSPEIGRIYFDGSTELERPMDWPVIYQREAGEQILRTDYLWPGDTTPSVVVQPWEVPRATGPQVAPVDTSATPGVEPTQGRSGRTPTLRTVTAMKSPPLAPVLGLAAAGGLTLGAGLGYHFYEANSGLDAGWERDPYKTVILPTSIAGGALVAVGAAGAGWKAVADRGGGAGILEAGGYAALAGGGVLVGQTIAYWDFTRRAGERLDDERGLLLGVGGTLMLTGTVSAIVGQRLADRRLRVR